MSRTDVVRLGSGAAHSRDLIEPGVALAESSQVDYLVYDALSEKQVLDNHVSKTRGGKAWDPHQEKRMRAVLPAAARTGTRIISNLGSADPIAAARRISEICAELDLPHLRVMAVTGDNLFDSIADFDPIVVETGRPVSAFGESLVAAHAYISGRGIVEALHRGADVVISGRVGDSAQFLAPLLYEFGWADDDWDHIGKGLGIGHLMECASQVSGGYFADPPYKVVPDLHRVGFPIAIVEPSGDAVITKLDGTGGLVSRQTVLEQLLYEIGDPRDYRHTDGTVDFTTTELTEIGPNRVRVSGTSGRPRPDNVKVLLGVQEGYFGVGRVRYGGEGAYGRARFVADTIRGRLSGLGFDVSKLHVVYEGVNALFPWHGYAEPAEVCLRIAGVFPTLEEAEQVPYEFDVLASCTGAAATACGRAREIGWAEEVVGLYTTFVPHEYVRPSVVEVVGGALAGSA